jgi:NDP-sugar pyrophosphorylase family protein
MNGDLLTTLDFRKMLTFHYSHSGVITIAVYPSDIQVDFGVVDSNSNDEFVNFREKPSFHFQVSMGVNILDRSVLTRLKPGQYLDMPNFIQNINDGGQKIYCYREECYWLDIGRMDDYALAQKQFEQNASMFLEVSP